MKLLKIKKKGAKLNFKIGVIKKIAISNMLVDLHVKYRHTYTHVY
jgi:hypothetical protein